MSKFTLYEELIAQLQRHLDTLRSASDALAHLDVVAALADGAERWNWVRPTLTDERVLRIEAGRHPVAEIVRREPFEPNDLDLHNDRRMLVITGPNMGGKSTYMRQNALIVLLAHIGSAVPASSATIGPIDRIFTRIGAGDDLARGQSTFMVEMAETARILHNASDLSLVLMDEIGRGTSTYDGHAIARACAIELAERNRTYTLFATHYFELTELADECEGVANVHLDAVEHAHALVFLHAVKPGGGEQAGGVLATVKREGIERKGTKWEAAEEQKFRQGVIDQIEHQGHPLYASARLWDDGIINPTKTRDVLALSLSASLNAPIPETRFGVFRM